MEKTDYKFREWYLKGETTIFYEGGTQGRERGRSTGEKGPRPNDETMDFYQELKGIGGPSSTTRLRTV